MEGLLYFAFGALNIGLLYLFTGLYRRSTGIDLFPGRKNGDTADMILSMIAYLLCGPFGTVIIILLGLFLLAMWEKYYRKK